MHQEYNFDGLVGPTHNYAGLSPGNLASAAHGGECSNPRAAALQGLDKMAALRELGVGQAILPPHLRPDVATLRRLGFAGPDHEVLVKSAALAPELLAACSSASAMWTANAATVAPSSDTSDGRLHLTVANLAHHFHRSLESGTTERVLRAIFSDEASFAVHGPLPVSIRLGDEGAANHCRLFSETGVVHLFAWGSDGGMSPTPKRYPARQTLEASQAVARLNQLPAECCLFWQQTPGGIDQGAFHTDVLAVGHGSVLLLHENAFVNVDGLLSELRARLGASFRALVARETELPVSDAVKSYPFNSQLIGSSDRMTLVGPTETAKNPSTKAFFDRVLAAPTLPVSAVKYLDVTQSMANGGGPACLRLRVQLTPTEIDRIRARVFLTPELESLLRSWVERHYRDRLTPSDLGDPALLRDSQIALDELTQLTNLGSIYSFQQP